VKGTPCLFEYRRAYHKPSFLQYNRKKAKICEKELFSQPESSTLFSNLIIHHDHVVNFIAAEKDFLCQEGNQPNEKRRMKGDETSGTKKSFN
jgi:hypothetical protein